MSTVRVQNVSAAPIWIGKAVSPLQPGDYLDVTAAIWPEAKLRAYPPFVAGQLLEVSAGTGVPATEPTYPGYPMVRLGRNLDITDAGSGTLVLQQWPYGNQDGVQITITIPAGQRTGIAPYPLAWSQRGDDFDASKKFEIVLTQVAGQIWATTRSIDGGISLVAPAVVSATVTAADPSTVAVLFDREVICPAITGWTCGGHTISTVTGTGTRTLNFGLATPFLYGEAARTLTWSSANVVQSQYGVALAASSVSVTNHAPGLVDLLTAGTLKQHLDFSNPTISSGVLVASLPDISGNGNHVIQATPGLQADLVAASAKYGGKNSIKLPAARTNGRYTFTGLIDVSAGFTMHWVQDFPAGGTVGFIIGGAANASPCIILMAGGGTRNFCMYDGSAKDSGYALASVSAGIHFVSCKVTDTTHGQFYVDNAAVGSNVAPGSLAVGFQYLFGNPSDQKCNDTEFGFHAIVAGAQSDAQRLITYNFAKTQIPGLP